MLSDNRSEAKHHDKYAVGVYVKRKSGNVLVGHVPAEISQLMPNFLNHQWRLKTRIRYQQRLPGNLWPSSLPKRYRPGTVALREIRG